MRVLIATDAWHPQVNGVVRTLTSLAEAAKGLGVSVEFLTHERFPTIPLPTYANLRLAIPNGGEIARRITKSPADVARIQGIPGLILAPGGVLIQFGKQTVGAIGVGGSSGPVNDELCAKAGIEKIREHLTP